MPGQRREVAGSLLELAARAWEALAAGPLRAVSVALPFVAEEVLVLA